VSNLQTVKLTVEGQSQALSLHVRCLDVDLATAQQQAADMAAAAQAAQEEHQAAVAAMQQALAAQAAAEEAGAVAAAERDAAVAIGKQAEAAREEACSTRQAAEQQAAEAAARAEAAASAAAVALTQATGAAAALDSLTEEHWQLKAQLAQLQEERQGLIADLDKAVSEVQRSATAVEQLQAERDRQRRLRNLAEQSCAAGAADQQAALKQAERLAALCEEQEQQCRQLQAQVSELQGRLGSQSALQRELVQVGLLPGGCFVCLLTLQCAKCLGARVLLAAPPRGICELTPLAALSAHFCFLCCCSAPAVAAVVAIAAGRAQPPAGG
jgi:hypothetical protein